MKSLSFAMTILLIAAATGPNSISSAFAAERATAAPSQSPRYELRYGYEHGGKWRAHWVLVK
jgi:hypothetical protein